VNRWNRWGRESEVENLQKLHGANMANELGRCKKYAKHLDLILLNASGKKIGEIRIKPNRILWALSGQKGWRGRSLRRFAAFMAGGKKQQK
jgi:hypothetical protein